MKEKTPFKLKAKEWFRKQLVKLKRNPNVFALLFVIISMVITTFSMTNYSHTTYKLNVPGMGISHFVITLCAILSCITYLQAYPKRQKPKLALIIIAIIMIALSIGMDLFYMSKIIYATQTRIDPPPVEITEELIYIAKTYNASVMHIVFCGISLVLIALTPLFRKLFSKFNTKTQDDSVEIESIEVSEE